MVCRSFTFFLSFCTDWMRFDLCDCGYNIYIFQWACVGERASGNGSIILRNCSFHFIYFYGLIGFRMWVCICDAYRYECCIPIYVRLPVIIIIITAWTRHWIFPTNGKSTFRFMAIFCLYTYLLLLQLILFYFFYEKKKNVFFSFFRTKRRIKKKL